MYVRECTKRFASPRIISLRVSAYIERVGLVKIWGMGVSAMDEEDRALTLAVAGLWVLRHRGLADRSHDSRR